MAAAIGGAGAMVAVLIPFAVQRAPAENPAAPLARLPGHVALPTRPGLYIGVFRRGVPNSYAAVTRFTRTTGVKPRVVAYYSGWLEPFQARFAANAARHNAEPLVQIDPNHVSLAAIASGHYDDYLRSYAAAVRAYDHPVILSFGHEMNGWWYSWGYRHTSPAVFVAAWRHIVTLFRAQGARDVTWLWTVNVINARRSVPAPARWWPGRSYVTWIGIDGYYYKPSWTFAPLFGPTIKAVHALTRTPIPIFIAETAAPRADQPAKIADLFAGIRAYGLLGFVWFDANHFKDWALGGPAAIAAFRRGAQAMSNPAQ